MIYGEAVVGNSRPIIAGWSWPVAAGHFVGGFGGERRSFQVPGRGPR